MALTAIFAKSLLLEGTMAPRQPIWIPMDAIFANPHNAYTDNM